MSDGESLPEESIDSASRRLGEVLTLRHNVAATLQTSASSFIGGRRRHMLKLSHWFSQSITSDDLLGHPDAMAICLPLSKSVARAETADRVELWEIHEAVRIGCERLGERTASSGQFFRALVYPITLLFLGTLLVVAFSLFLAPVFERMFFELGLSLPSTTFFVLGLARQIRRWWSVAFLISAVVAVLFLGVSLRSRFRKNRQGKASLSEHLTSSPRAAIAKWTWHVALLLEAGLSQSDAIAIAGRSSNQSWLKRCSDDWSSRLRRGNRPFDSLEQLHGCRIHSLSYALRLNDTIDQVSLLNAVASNYWEQGRNHSRWWLSWLAPLTVWVVGIVIGTFVTAMFMPLIKLISGLT